MVLKEEMEMQNRHKQQLLIPMAMHACNPTLNKVQRQEDDSKFKASLGYVVTSRLACLPWHTAQESAISNRHIQVPTNMSTLS